MALNDIIESTSTIINSALEMAKKNVIRAWESHEPGQDFAQTITDTFDEIESPFSSLSTNYLQASYIKKNLNYVEPKEIVLGKKISRKNSKNKRLLVEKEETFQYIPLIESLCQLLSNKKIAKVIVRKPNQCDEDIFYDICDGKVFKSDTFFTEHPDALQIIIYHDAVEVCNPLGSQTGRHKLDMFYYTLGNLNPKLRSRHCAVRLLAIVNAKLVRKYGYSAVLKPIIEDLKKIECGFPCIVNGTEKLVYGKVVSCAGDTEGQHEWGGYKVGVGFAFQKCRHCQCHFEAMQHSFYEEDFISRTKESYERQCREIEEAPTEQLKSDLETTYGITSRSLLCDLDSFDVTKQLPQDIMHTLLEGVVQYELRHILAHYISQGHFTLCELNTAIASQNYGYSEVADKPGPLRESVFSGNEAYKLKYKAAQARLFLRLLPFILCTLRPNDDHDIYSLITELIEICQIIFSPVISLPTINLLKLKIGAHLTHFKEQFPEVNIIPKQHYMIHIPTMIKELGPLIRHSCFAFESAHNYFKELAPKQNFKNLPKSLAERCQFKECGNFADCNEAPQSHPLFSSEKNFGSLTLANEEQKRNLRQKLNISGLLPCIQLQNAYKTTWLSCYGTRFKSGGIFICNVDEDLVRPIFGTICVIWMIRDFIYFEYTLMDTLCFNEEFQAYQVKSSEEVETKLCPYESLVDFNILHLHEDNEGGLYVPMKYDIADLMEQHLKGDNPLKY